MNERVYAKAKTGTYVGKRTAPSLMEFLGIRYMQAPLRWKPGKKLPESNALISALENAPIPAQVTLDDFPDCAPFACEDALALNIYTSDLNTKKPVYVFIHGGNFLFGGVHTDGFNGVYNGDQFVINHPDIVYVNITYRTSIFGSIDLRSVDPDGEYADSMNLNILDQMRALEWIYENIEAFGGDPDHITIGGQSAGSYSVTTLCMIPEARKYFKAAILESSSPTNAEMKTLDVAAQGAKVFMDIANAHTLKELLNLTSDELVKYGEDAFYAGPRGIYGPTRDGKLVPLMPEEALTEAAKDGIVWLSGTNCGEYDTMMTDMTNDEIVAMIKRRNPACTDADVAEFKANDPNRDERTALQDMHNDCGLRVRQILGAEAYVKGGGTVYYYYTTYQPKGNFIRCQHCTELLAVSGKPYAKNSLEKPEREQWMMGKEPDFGYYQLINDIWCNFIRTYNPSGRGVGTWAPYTLDEKLTGIIGDNGDFEVVPEPRTKDMDIARRMHHDIVLEAEARH